MNDCSSERPPARPHCKVVILTALQIEYEAVRTHIAGDCGVRTLNDGTVYEVGRFDGDRINWTVAIAEIGAGNENAAIEATKAIAELNPNLLMFVGVAGSLKPKDAPHGSVVVAETVYGYHGGKDSEEFAARPLVFRTWHSLSQLVRYVRRDWCGAEGISVLVAPIAAGNVVIASSKSRTYELIRSHFNDAAAVEMESVGLYAAADRAQRLPVLSVRGISDCVDDKTADADVEWQPIAARNSAAFAFALLRAIDAEAIGSPLQDSVDAPLAEAREWERVPYAVAELLQRVSEEHGAEAATLLSALASGREDPQSAVDAFLPSPPAWLDAANSELLWAALGEFAAAHGLHASAVDAFDRAAEATGGTGPWGALSALELAVSQTSEKALERLGTAAESTELPIALVRAVIEGDTAGVLAATTEADGTNARAGGWRVQALRIEDRVAEAAELAQRIVDRHPGAAGSALILATLLVQTAQQDASTLGYERSLLRARELALTARDLRRGWGGDSVEATVLAGGASVMLRDPLAALNVSSLPDEGSALPCEASSDDVRQIRVDALMLLNRDQDALDEAGRFSDEVKRKLVQADCLGALGRKDRAEALYSEALEILGSAPLEDPDVPPRLFQGLIGLAELGVSPLPLTDRLREVSPEAATKVEIISDIARGDTKAAIQRARKSGAPGFVGLLAQALLKAGQTDDAVFVLKDAAARLGRNEYLLQAIHVLSREQRFSEAYKEALEALAVAPDQTPVKTELRRAAVEAAAQIPDWGAACKQARAAVLAGDRSDAMRWTLVMALNNTMSPEEALREAMTAPALKPRTEQEGRLLISLHSIRGEGLESIAAVLDVAEQYPESEEVGAAAVGSVLMLSRDCDLPEDMRERLTKSAEHFFERYPDSPHLMRIEGTPEKILEVLEASGDPWNVPAVREVIESITTGALPLHLLTELSGKPYCELVVKRGTGWTVGESRDPSVREREQSAAVASIGHAVVIEASAVFGAMSTERPLDSLISLFATTVAAQVSVEDAIRGASQLSLRSTSSMRWDSVSGKGILDENAPEQADRWAHDAEEIERVLRASAPRVPTGRAQEVEKFPLILQPVQLAMELGLPLYSDDVALRLLAASQGVPTFGTTSLLAAAEEHRLLNPEQVAEATDGLRRNLYADLDWSSEDLLRIAEQEAFQQTGGALGALARPGFWSDPIRASDSYRSLLGRLAEAEAETEVLAGWHAAATLGFLGALNPVARSRAAGGLLAAAFFVFGMQSAALPSLLSGARSGATARGAEDPLPDFCRVLIKALSSTFGEAQGGRMYVDMMQQLTPEDRTVALRVLLNRERPKEEGL